MGEHEIEKAPTSVPIYRPWNKIDPKVIIGAVSSLTVGGVVTAFAAFGITVPAPVAMLIVILIYAAAAYWTRTRIPISTGSGLTPQMAAGASSAVDAGVELADGDLQQAAADASHAAGHVLDRDEKPTSNPPTS